MNDIAAEKTALRTETVKQLRAMTAEDRVAHSEEICERVLEMAEWAQAQTVILFSPLPSEPIIDPLKLDCQARKVNCIKIGQSVKSETDLQLPDTIDLVLVPGLAFSKDRHRLGRGGGFFDRLLSGRAANAFKLALAFDVQVFDHVPIEGHDVVMDAVVTETQTLR